MQETPRVRTGKKTDVVDLTRQVAAAVTRARIEEGVCTVYVRHATAAIVINENADPGFRLGLLLGTWQGVALVERDGPREREVAIDIRG